MRATDNLEGPFSRLPDRQRATIESVDSVQEEGSLVFEGVDEDSNDYRLKGRSAWISVDELSVYVHRTSEGVAVDIYPRSDEADAPALASCEADFADASAPLK